MDRLTNEQRKRNMKAVKSKNSKIELTLRKALWKKGHRYRNNYKKLIGKPDIVLTKYRIAIFCDSEFWHGFDWKNKSKAIKTNRDFWIKKIERNIERDKEVNKKLTEQGYKVIRFWGKEILKNTDNCVKIIEEEIKKAKIIMTKTLNKTIKYSDLRNKILQFCKNQKELSYFTHYLQSIGTECRDFYETKERNLFLYNYLIGDSKIEFDVPFKPIDFYRFTFIDLFAGIGGFRIAFQKLGGRCVFSSEWNKESQKTYDYNFGEIPFGDITKINENAIPNHDLLLAGFPCQAFSIAGKRKGFEDTRGTLFFDVARIIQAKNPKAFLLENVKGLLSHNKGKTLKRILEVLRNELNYYVPEPHILNAKDFGVPQNRERILIVGFRKDLDINNFEYPHPIKNKITFSSIKEKNTVSVKYYLSKQYLSTLRKHKERHKNKGNGFGYEIIDDEGIANALVVGGMGRERNLVIDKRLKDFTPVTHIKGEVNREGIRRMTPREWARLQGFPENFLIKVSDTQAYKQFGNSVAVPVIKETGTKIVEILSKRNII